MALLRPFLVIFLPSTFFFHKTENLMVISRCLLCLNLNWIKSYDIFLVNKIFFTAWKCIISGVVWESEFWDLRTKSALIFSKWLIQRRNIPHFKDFGTIILQYELRICQKLILKAQWYKIVTTRLGDSHFISQILYS